MATVSVVSTGGSKTFKWKIEFKYGLQTISVDHEINLNVGQLPYFKFASPPTVYTDYVKLTDNILRLAGVRSPSGDLWEEVRDAIMEVVPEMFEFPI